MDNKATTKRMIGAVVLVLVAALLLAWLLKGKNRDGQQLASNQTSEISPIKGFPGVGGEEKPSLVGEPADGAAQQQGEGADDAQQRAAQDDGKGGLIPDINMPDTAKDTTGFDVRPGGEKRPVVDTDGKVKTGEGSMGTGDTAAQNGGAAQQQQQQVGSVVQDKPAGSGSASQSAAGGGTASQDDAPAEKKPASSSSRVVLVNERPVPRATSAESAAAAAKKKAEQEAAAAKAKEQAAADKAAEAKSVALANAAAGGSGGFSIQVVATSSKAKADSVAGPIAADGYQVAVQPANVGGKTVYRVKVTGYPNRAAAAAAQAKMKARYTRNQYVQNSFLTSN